MGLEVRCKRWGCVVCINYLKAAWSDNLWRRLLALPGPVYRWRGPDSGPTADLAAVAAMPDACAAEAFAAAAAKAWWGATERAIRRKGGEYCRVKLADRQVLVIATAPFAGSAPVPAADAAREVVDAVCAVPLVLSDVRRKVAGRRVSHRPVTTSYGWALPDQRTGQWQRLAQPKLIDRANTVLTAMGVEVVEDPPVRPGTVQRRFMYTFPDGWDEQAVAYGLGWAECLTVPDGWAPGQPLPDPDQVWRDLVAAADLLPCAPPPPPGLPPEPQPAPAAPPRAKPAPPAVPRPFEFLLTNVVRLDPAGRWRIVEQGPDWTVFRWSRRAYRTREFAEAALAANRYRLAPLGVYPDRVEVAPDPAAPDKTPNAADGNSPTAAA